MISKEFLDASGRCFGERYPSRKILPLENTTFDGEYRDGGLKLVCLGALV